MQSQNFIPADLNIQSFKDIEPFLKKLQAFPINTVADLEQCILCASDFNSVYAENSAWTYIRMTCNTQDELALKRHELFSQEISPKLEQELDHLNRKIFASPFFCELPSPRYDRYKMCLEHEIKMFNEKNIPLSAQESELTTAYSQLAGALSAKFQGQDLPLPQVAIYFESADRAIRQEAWLCYFGTYQTQKDKWDDLFTKMCELRQNMALNAGYKNYRDYAHEQMERFDYSVNDVLKFHDSILQHVVPLRNNMQLKKFNKLQLSTLRPWDLSAPEPGCEPLRPFKTGAELLNKTKKIFGKLDSQFESFLTMMEQKKLFDLDSRAGKAPGGYNYGLEVTGMPFIFMNAVGSAADVKTLMHEGGHAMHTFLTHPEVLVAYRNTPSEMAETASMSMELMTMEFWNEFYSEAEHKRAKRQQLESIVSMFCWVAIVDAFQHWVYTHPGASVLARDMAFDELMVKYGIPFLDWSGYEQYRQNFWQKQLHIFEVPFYYIEYAMAQLGALQVWDLYLQNPQLALQNYKKGLALGSSLAIGEVWQNMGIKFDFSAPMLKKLMARVEEEYSRL